MCGCGLRSQREPFVHRSALVCFEVAEGDPAQTIHFDNAIEGVAIERKHLAKPGMEHQRFVSKDEKLIECKPAGGAISGT